MNTNKILLSGLVGAVVAFLLGFLVYGILLSSFFEANLGSATGVMRADDEMLWVPMILGHVAWGLMLAFVYVQWANISTFVTGAKGGAILGLLISATFDLINLGSTHVMNATGAVVDIVVMVVVTAITGGVIGWFLGRNKAVAE